MWQPCRKLAGVRADRAGRAVATCHSDAPRRHTTRSVPQVPNSSQKPKCSHDLVPRLYPAPLCIVRPVGVASALQTGTPSVGGRGPTASERMRTGTCTQVCNGHAASSGVMTSRHGSHTQQPSRSKTTPAPHQPPTTATIQTLCK